MNKAQLLAKLGLGKDVPVTAQNLSDAFPEVIGEIIDTAHAAGAASVDQKAVGKAAAAAELAGVLLMATAFFGEAATERFKALLAAGVTPDQVKALGIVPEASAAESEAERQKKAEILAALQRSGAENPGAGGGSSRSQEFQALVQAYQTEHRCSRIDAIRATANAHPEIHAAYIRLVNTKKGK